jgi:hypothetical protein
MKRIYTWLTSMPFMGFLLLALAFAMGWLFCVKLPRYGGPAAQQLFINRHGFELILGATTP